MNALGILALVCLGFVLLSGLLLAVAYINHHWQRRRIKPMFQPEGLSEPELHDSKATSAAQVGICTLIGLATGSALYVGWCATWMP
jgi:hypothetical protein